MIIPKPVTRAVLQFALCAALCLATAHAEPPSHDEDPYRNWSLVTSSAPGPVPNGLGTASGPRLLSPPIPVPPINLALSRARTRIDDVDVTATSIAGSMEYSFFGLTTVEAPSFMAAGGLPLVPPPFAFSLGLEAGTNPAEGELYWRGVLVGSDSGSGAHGSSIFGGVDILIADFSSPKAVIAFHSLFDFDAGEWLEDIHWSDVTVENGRFASGADGHRVEGRFYGPNHEEVGGTFESGGIAGAFGGGRLIDPDLPELETEGNDLSDPNEFVAALARAALTGDLTFGGGGSARFGAGLPTLVGEASEIGEVPEGPAIEFGATTIAVRGSVPREGVLTGQIEWNSSFRTPLPGLELEVDFEFDGRFHWLAGGGTVVGASRTALAGGGEGLPLPDVSTTYQVAMGRTTFRDLFEPDAQWTGATTGIDLSAGPALGNSVEGDSRLSINELLSPTLDVELSNLSYTGNVGSHAALTWSNVPISSGVFRAAQEGDEIHGFLLDITEEALGIFERDGVFGSFSAVREVELGRAAVSITDRDGAPFSFGALGHFGTMDLESLLNASAALTENPSLISNALASAAPILSTFNGIAISESRAPRIPLGRESASFEVFGGWLEHAYFATVGIQSGPLDEPEAPILAIAGILGQCTGANPPPGRARWEGAMLGRDASGTRTHGNRVRGVASITFEDLSYPNVDVIFTDVIDLTAGSPRLEMKWLGIPVSSGEFEASVDDHRVTGQFFGPSHEEVAGTFHWHDIVGSFGAIRVQP